MGVLLKAVKMRYLTLIFAPFSFVASFKSYHEHTVLRTEKLSMEKTQILRDLQVRTNLDFGRFAYPFLVADIMVSDKDMAGLKDFLEKKNIESSVMVENVQSLIEETRPRNMSAKGTMDWDDYYPHEDLVAFIQGLADTNADWARIINVGQTYEGRDMNVLAIEKAGPGAPNVWLEAGIHAREWIAPAVATYLVNELVTNNDAHPDYLDKINWYFLPCANPDGYTYSWETDRMWRKTRSPQGGCFGVDPNRNWDYHWGETGVSSNPCTDIFPGDKPFSEVETANIAAFVQTLDPVPVLSQCFHSYSQLQLWPYGYDYGAYPDNYEEIQQLAIDSCDAIYAVHGTVFDPINSADLYPASGAADDWYKGVLGSRFTFTTELRDTGNYGFILPPDQIIDSGEEIWAAMEVIIKQLLTL